MALLYSDDLRIWHIRREPLMDGRLQGGVRASFAKRVPAQGYRTVAVPGRSLDGAQEDECLRARTIIRRLDQCLFCERTRALCIAGSELGYRPQDRPSVASFAIVVRRQAAGELAQLRSDTRHAPNIRDGSRLVERRGDLRVRTLRREREVAGALQRIANDLGENRVRRAAVSLRRLRGRRSKQGAGVRTGDGPSLERRSRARSLLRARPRRRPCAKCLYPGPHRGQEHERLP